MLEEVDVDIDGRADCGQQAGQVACTFLKTELTCFDSRVCQSQSRLFLSFELIGPGAKHKLDISES